MRELKFRAWDKKAKKMWVMYDNQGDLHLGGEIRPICFFWGDEDYILMQYTGLKDKNGKEIYEGDILKSITMDGKVHYEPVKFDNGCFCKLTKLPDTNKKIWSSLRYHLYKRKLIAYEVVGNVFENHDLLKQ